MEQNMNAKDFIQHRKEIQKRVDRYMEKLAVPAGSDETIMEIKNSMMMYRGRKSDFLIAGFTGEGLHPLAYWEADSADCIDAVMSTIDLDFIKSPESPGVFKIAHFFDGEIVGIFSLDSFQAVQFAASLPIAIWTLAMESFCKDD